MKNLKKIFQNYLDKEVAVYLVKPSITLNSIIITFFVLTSTGTGWIRWVGFGLLILKLIQAILVIKLRLKQEITVMVIKETTLQP